MKQKFVRVYRREMTVKCGFLNFSLETIKNDYEGQENISQDIKLNCMEGEKLDD